MTDVISINLRRCTRCGHLECPCCRSWCDTIVGDDVCPCFEEDCVYRTEDDAAGYALLDAALKAAGVGALISVVDERTIHVTKAKI